MERIDHYAEYRAKLRTPEEAVKVIKSGDWVDYMTNVTMPVLLDKALAKRRDELTDVKIRGNLIFGPIEAVECDPKREHFIYNSWHCSSYERKLCDRGLCNFIPMVFHNVVPYYRHFLTVNVAMMCVTPMDRHGYFNLSSGTGVAKGILEKADIVILEVNENLPWIYGGFDECIHISDVDYVVEGPHDPLPGFPYTEPTSEDMAIAKLIIPYIKDGATIQLGIGSMPNAVGSLIADSDLRDLGMHTELLSDAYLELHRAGKLTNRKKKLHRDKGVAGITIGSQDLYGWVDRNPGVVAMPLEYVNAPEVIGQHDDMISISSGISVDLFGQVCAESAGLRHISGTVEGRESLYLHVLDLQGQRRPATFPDRALFHGRHCHGSPEPGLPRGHGVRLCESGGPHYLGAVGDADLHCPPRFPGRPDPGGGAHEDLETQQ